MLQDGPILAPSTHQNVERFELILAFLVVKPCGMVTLYWQEKKGEGGRAKERVRERRRVGWLMDGRWLISPIEQVGLRFIWQATCEKEIATWESMTPQNWGVGRTKPQRGEVR
jgi:hypothetical protein